MFNYCSKTKELYFRIIIKQLKHLSFKISEIGKTISYFLGRKRQLKGTNGYMYFLGMHIRLEYTLSWYTGLKSLQKCKKFLRILLTKQE